MGDKTAIEWTDKTFNAWWGCAKVSPGCDNCYAEAWAKRTGTAPWGVDAPRREFGPKHWNEPMRWHLQALREGRRFRVFCASMADVFDKNAPVGARERLWHLIANTPSLDWQLLTKRIGNAKTMLPADWGDGWANVWLGISVVNQEEADRDIPKLLQIPARVRFLSCEPLLGPIDLTGEYLADRCGGRYPFPNLPREHRTTRLELLDWVIAGGESGPKARPSHPDWHRSLRDQCAEAGVPFLFKQWGEWWETASELRDEERQHVQVDVGSGEAREWFERGDLLVAPDGRTFDSPDSIPTDTPCRLMTRLGKKAAGRALDGRTHDGYPVVNLEKETA